MRAWSTVCLVGVFATGCGGAGATEHAVVNEDQWRANTAVIIRQLRADIAVTQASGDTPASAQAALADESALYGLLVSYSDFAGCHEMVAGAGPLPRTAVRADRALIASCGHLERASELFTQAVTQNDGASLLAAGRESSRALPSLVRAAARLK